ncbi:YigZ family protein [Amycolatopsis antarctica]|uniref:YigZ family protein n=1 Tax=Amycolatopsis antarctica TaxID=1854586 RepID=A0A263D4K3_9PSEU|nr:YigZ family protein [Amycolatopsis antarctica]OZM72295.1 YigZ family protein [Amycolatopsis antarctica]
MRVIANGGTHEIELQRSRFLCHLGRIDGEDAAVAFIAAVRREHRSANHNCSAFRIGSHAESQRSSDDGEPAGTAGVPMLEVLVRRELTDIVAVVTRYFGGVKLGAGGLVRAYGSAVAAAVDTVGTVRRLRFASLRVGVGHADAGRLRNALHAAGHRIATVDYAREATFTVHVPQSGTAAFREWLAGQTAGAAVAVEGEPVDLDVPD